MARLTRFDLGFPGRSWPTAAGREEDTERGTKSRAAIPAFRARPQWFGHGGSAPAAGTPLRTAHTVERSALDSARRAVSPRLVPGTHCIPPAPDTPSNKNKIPASDTTAASHPRDAVRDPA